MRAGWDKEGRESGTEGGHSAGRRRRHWHSAWHIEPWFQIRRIDRVSNQRPSDAFSRPRHRAVWWIGFLAGLGCGGEVSGAPCEVHPLALRCSCTRLTFCTAYNVGQPHAVGISGARQAGHLAPGQSTITRLLSRCWARQRGLGRLNGRGKAAVFCVRAGRGNRERWAAKDNTTYYIGGGDLCLFRISSGRLVPAGSVTRSRRTSSPPMECWNVARSGSQCLKVSGGGYDGSQHASGSQAGTVGSDRPLHRRDWLPGASQSQLHRAQPNCRPNVCLGRVSSSESCESS